MSTLLLTRADIRSLMTPADYLNAVELAFKLSKRGEAPSPAPIHLPGLGGAFHGKGAVLLGEKKRAVLKLNGNFPGNPANGLPTIQGVVLLCDAENGSVLAVMDSIEITLQRTAAASALAAKHLARQNAKRLSVIGCGAQALPHAQAMLDVLPIEGGAVWDTDRKKTVTMAAAMSDALGVDFAAANSLREAARSGDVIVTCTTATTPFLCEADVTPGAFIAAVGADSPQKSEIFPALMARAKVVPDVLTQCLEMGDLRHAIAAGVMTAEQIYGELADIVAAPAHLMRSPQDIFLFDSTGTAIEDAASASEIYDRALQRGAGMMARLS